MALRKTKSGFSDPAPPPSREKSKGGGERFWTLNHRAKGPLRQRGKRHDRTAIPKPRRCQEKLGDKNLFVKAMKSMDKPFGSPEDLALSKNMAKAEQHSKKVVVPPTWERQAPLSRGELPFWGVGRRRIAICWRLFPLLAGKRNFYGSCGGGAALKWK